MAENKVNLRECAMRYGTSMGLLWAFKFILFPLGFRIPFLQFIFMILTLGVPILGYVFAKKFRDKYCGGEIDFLRAWLFTVFMYMFASLLVAVVHYVYFQFVDGGFILNAYLNAINELRVGATPTLLQSFDQLEENLQIIGELSALQLTLQMISINVTIGVLTAFPTALFVMRKKKN